MNQCKHCGKFISDNKRFCDIVCWGHWYWKEKYGSFKKFKVKCHVCGNEFYVVEREKRFPMKERYFCSSHCVHHYSGSCRWNKSRREKQSHRIEKLWRNKRTYNVFGRISIFDVLKRYSFCKKVALFLLVIFPFFYVDNVSFNNIKENYGDWRLENIFYARTLGIRTNRKILEKVFDYSVRFNKDYRLMLCWCYVESRFYPEAISIAGARGILQVMPPTAMSIVTIVLIDNKDQFGWTLEEKERIREDYDLFNLEDNLLIAFTYISMLEKSSKNLDEVLAKYYSGKYYRSYLDHEYVYTIKALAPIKNRKIYRSL